MNQDEKTTLMAVLSNITTLLEEINKSLKPTKTVKKKPQQRNKK